MVHYRSANDPIVHRFDVRRLSALSEPLINIHTHTSQTLVGRVGQALLTLVTCDRRKQEDSNLYNRMVGLFSRELR
jgi:hypothetical protein